MPVFCFALLARLMVPVRGRWCGVPMTAAAAVNGVRYNGAMHACIMAEAHQRVQRGVVPEIALGLLVLSNRPALLVAEVPDLTPFKGLESVECRLWMRWAEPDQTGLPEPRIEIAMEKPSDGCIATIIGRTGVLTSDVARTWYRFLEDQGTADLLFYEAGPASAEYSHWFVNADVSEEFEEFDIRVGEFPERYC